MYIVSFPECGKLTLYLHIVENIPSWFPHCGNYQCFFHKIIHIVNYLEYVFHISSIEPKDLRGLPQILPKSAKFLPRACSRRSRNIPSLPPFIWSSPTIPRVFTRVFFLRYRRYRQYETGLRFGRHVLMSFWQFLCEWGLHICKHSLVIYALINLICPYV